MKLLKFSEVISMINLSDLYAEINTFCSVVECGTFSKAAEKIGMSQSTVSRKIKDLESVLNYSLIRRSTRNLEITEQGKMLYDFFVEQQSNFNQYILLQQQQRLSLHGRVKIVLPEIIAFYLITPYIGKFLQDNPGIELEIYYQNRELNLFKEKFDLAVVNHIPKQQTVKIKFLGSQKLYLYCSPEYIQRYGLITEISQIKQHLYTGIIDHEHKLSKTLDFLTPEAEKVNLENNSRLYINSMLSGKQLCLGGHVISGGIEPVYAKEVRDGTMIKLLPEFSVGEFTYYLVTLPQTINASVKCVAKFIEDCFAKIRD